jgi:hypothetical protein
MVALRGARLMSATAPELISWIRKAAQVDDDDDDYPDLR